MKISELRFNSYGRFLQETFGTRVHKVSVHAGFTCPNRDGTAATGGCTYCNIDSFTPRAARARVPVKDQVQQAIGYLKKRFKAHAFIVYFQPYSNTYAPIEHLEKLYAEALDHPGIVGLAVGTRPDCIDGAKLDLFEQIRRDYFVTLEYGIESVNDETLRIINRAHDYACTVNAIQQTSERGLHVAGHIILGFPNESTDQMLATADEVSKLPLNFLKIHNLHIVRYTELAKAYLQNPFHIFSFQEWVEFVCHFLERLNPDIVIERLYGGAPLDLLITPNWRKSAAQIIYAIQKELEHRNTHQGRLYGRSQKEDRQKTHAVVDL
ncbi:MAG TPA: TIGR01212 family radical SAM protein [bacterium]